MTHKTTRQFFSILSISFGTMFAFSHILSATIPASATVSYSTQSAVITNPEGCTATTEIAEDGTITSILTSDQTPDQKDVTIMTKDKENYRFREYSGKDFLISVTPADAAAFEQEFGDAYGLAKQSDGTYILCAKGTEAQFASAPESAGIAVSDWGRADAEAIYAQVCGSDAVESAEMQQWYSEYTYDEGSFLLHLFATEPVTADQFDFLPDGYSVEIDADENYPSVNLIGDGVNAADYAARYQIYRSLLEEIPSVYAIHHQYWYLQFESGTMHYDVIAPEDADAGADEEQSAQPQSDETASAASDPAPAENSTAAAAPAPKTGDSDFVGALYVVLFASMLALYFCASKKDQSDS